MITVIGRVVSIGAIVWFIGLPQVGSVGHQVLGLHDDMISLGLT